MRNRILLTAGLALFLSGTASWAQEQAPEAAQGTPAETSDAAGDNPLMSMGVEEAPADGPGTIYLKENFNDWELRCIRVEEGQQEPCQLYQLLRDEGGNAVSEIILFPVSGAGNAVAGARIVTPLETLLSQPIRMSVDGGTAKRYPYTFCTPNECVAQIGFSDEDISSFKRGNAAAVGIVPLVAPDQLVNLTMSLSGFTAGYTALRASAGLE